MCFLLNTHNYIHTHTERERELLSCSVFSSLARFLWQLHKLQMENRPIYMYTGRFQ